MRLLKPILVSSLLALGLAACVAEPYYPPAPPAPVPVPAPAPVPVPMVMPMPAPVPVPQIIVQQPMQSPMTMNFQGQLSGAQEVPQRGVIGAGAINVSFDRNTRVLSYAINYANLTGPLQGAHCHGPATPGLNAPVTVNLPVTAAPMNGTVVLNDLQATELMQGRWYVNLHTAAFPDGEIRGQLMPLQ